VTRDARDELAALGVAVTLGGDGAGLLDAAPAPACIVKSPGIPFGVPLLAAAAARGLPVLDELELGWRLDDRPTVAVTGTNGKSTVAELLRAILAADGRRPVIAGNTLSGLPLSAVPRDAADTIVCEASSFQLGGTSAFLADAAAVTNLTPEHLWHHGTLERYAACKRRLVIQGDAVVPIAAIGVEEDFGADLADEAERRGSRVARVGSDGDYAVERAELGWAGTQFRARTPSGVAEVAIASHGMHMATNALTALALADLLGVDRAVILPALAAAAPVPGRFERVDGGGPVAVVVDFAHNPDGIARALATARALAGTGRVRAVCSAAWTSDAAALEDMGRAAAGGADVVIVTTDRWRPDHPLDPPAALEHGARAEGCRDLRAEPDRGAAIADAIAAAEPGDVVMILGRGARTVAVDATGARVEFDDRAVARAALA
jgi:UDP-N-acetylmuramoyl-L-alanyl-D-glutamate--2,6-diaminopimelate ligase